MSQNKRRRIKTEESTAEESTAEEEKKDLETALKKAKIKIKNLNEKNDRLHVLCKQYQKLNHQLLNVNHELSNANHELFNGVMEMESITAKISLRNKDMKKIIDEA